MRRAAAAFFASVACLASVPALAQGLFDDNEARRRVEALRQQVSESQRLVEERLSKIEASVSGSTDRSVVLDLATERDQDRLVGLAPGQANRRAGINQQLRRGNHDFFCLLLSSGRCERFQTGWPRHY